MIHRAELQPNLQGKSFTDDLATQQVLYLLSGNSTSHFSPAESRRRWTATVCCLFQKNPSFEVNRLSGQTLKLFPQRQEANYYQQVRLPIMHCFWFLWKKLESHYNKRCVVIRFNECIIIAVCACMSQMVTHQPWSHYEDRRIMNKLFVSFSFLQHHKHSHINSIHTKCLNSCCF